MNSWRKNMCILQLVWHTSNEAEHTKFICSEQTKLNVGPFIVKDVTQTKRWKCTFRICGAFGKIEWCHLLPLSLLSEPYKPAAFEFYRFVSTTRPIHIIVRRLSIHVYGCKRFRPNLFSISYRNCGIRRRSVTTGLVIDKFITLSLIRQVERLPYSGKESLWIKTVDVSRKCVSLNHSDDDFAENTKPDWSDMR